MKNITIYGLILISSMGLFISCGKSDTHSQHEEPDACCQKPEATNKNTPANTRSDNNSIYQLSGEWVNQDSEKIELKQLEGKIQLMTMVFTNCGYACPKMVGNIRAIERELPDNIKSRIGYVLVSFDTERDTPKKLHEYAVKENLDNSWTLLHGTDNQVRILSMLLQTQYSQLPDGDFNHSNVLTILNDKGEIIKQLEGLDIVATDVVSEIIQLTKQM